MRENDDEIRNEINQVGHATIGKSITLKGEITGTEDLTIYGCVEGTINLRQNTVTVGKGARVNAEIRGNIIHVEGEVNGDLRGTEQVVVHKSGQVRGNITSPRLTLEDGARLKGSIDTEAPSDDTSSMQLEKSVVERSKHTKNGDGNLKESIPLV